MKTAEKILSEMKILLDETAQTIPQGKQQSNLQEIQERLLLLQKMIEEMQSQIQHNKKQAQKLNKELIDSYSTGIWRLQMLLYRLRDETPLRHVYNTVRFFRRKGFTRTIRKITETLLKNKKKQGQESELNLLLQKNTEHPLLVFLPILDWSLPLFQRPQHIAMNLASYGMLYFYCTGNQRYDNVSGFNEITTNCYLTNRFDLLKNCNRKKIYHLYSTDRINGIDFVQREIKKGNIILYEYVDTIHEMVYRRPISPRIMERHHYIIQDENCLVVTTADKLYHEVLNYRSKNCILCTNGVEYSHFHHDWSNTPVPSELVKVLEKKRPIIGYFGALAKWLDYELIKFLASRRREYEFLIIGWNYDDSIKSAGLDRIPNIHVIGPIDYKHLPQYARLFTVATIPFLLNEVTDSTSPIKLFEYMALGHPIVSTDIPECRKYQSVIIAKDQDEFVRHVDRAIALKSDHAYQLLINKEALENTWASKAKSIAKMIFDNEKR